jgi:hypothetical protein
MTGSALARVGRVVVVQPHALAILSRRRADAARHIPKVASFAAARAGAVGLLLARWPDPSVAVQSEATGEWLCHHMPIFASTRCPTRESRSSRLSGAVSPLTNLTGCLR